MSNNVSVEKDRDNDAPCEDSGEWVITLYEPYHLPPEPKEEGDEGEGWI